MNRMTPSSFLRSRYSSDPPLPITFFVSRLPMLWMYIRSNLIGAQFLERIVQRLLRLLGRVGPHLAGQEHVARAVLRARCRSPLPLYHRHSRRR